MHARFVKVEAKHKASIRGIKRVEMARIPILDLVGVGGYVQENQLHFLSYRLWDSKVRRNGVINRSVRVKVPEYYCPVPVPVPVPAMQVTHDGYTRVVIGVPVCLNYQGNP